LSKEKNLKLLGVNFKDKKKQAEIFLNDLGNPYDFLTKDELGKNSVKFGVYGIPESILVNKDLMILKKFVGPLSTEDYNLIIGIIN
jgi:cytochrome c biogenesis protein CcmG/thiol:disulfide interchange protein DsbE